MNGPFVTGIEHIRKKDVSKLEKRLKKKVCAETIEIARKKEWKKWAMKQKFAEEDDIGKTDDNGEKKSGNEPKSPYTHSSITNTNQKKKKKI
jgi:hypothetical protein